ncbi:MAG: outer membrane protein assembly factor BamA [Acidobacteria bacterium]|nr:MAG: outer membrane protein assembly factor BamA [Acidobacteriota bacterium]
MQQDSPAVAKSGRTVAGAGSLSSSSRTILNLKNHGSGHPILRLLLSLLLVACPLWGQENVITEIVVHGNRRIPVDTIKARIFTKPGDIYDQAALERDFNSLWNTGYFQDIRIEREQTLKGWRIHVYVSERPTIREINYSGLNSVSTSDVLDRFKERKVGLSVESQYDPTKVKKAEVTLKELLSEHGRQFATVRTEVRTIPPAAVGITFVVREGPKVKVGKIRFQGNKHVSSRTLRSAMKNLRPIGIPHSIFLENIFAKTYDASKLNEDTERVRAEYQNRGYFKVLVEDPKTQIHDTGGGFSIPLFHGKGKAVDITMPIEEGDRYRLGSITFKNNKAVTNTKALRGLFPIKDEDIFSREKIAKGLENLRDAYGELGYINFTPVPDTTFDEDKKLVNVIIDVDEGKQYYVRRIEFQGNTTTRDKVIRRELALEEGQIYNNKLWKYSLLRLNQLGFFEPLRPEDPNTTERKLNDQEGTVDLTLKVKEKGRNQIGLTGGVSGLAGAFVGINYSTNNLFGLGETLNVQASVGNRQRNIMFGFTEPYLFDRPLQFGFTVFTQKYNFDQANQLQILTGQRTNFSQAVLNTLQNFTQATTGFTVSLSYPLHRSLKRVGLTYSFDNSSTQVFSAASQALFQNLAFRGFAGPNALNGVKTSKVLPNFSFSTIDSPLTPHTGKSIFLGGEIAGLGGTVQYVRPIIQWKQWFPMQKRRNTIGYNIQASFLSGYGGLVAPPFDRFYMGGENDIRGFDIRTVSPLAFLSDKTVINLTNPDGTFVPKDPSNPRRGAYTIPIPVERLVAPGGDFSLVGNAEYRIYIVGPVALAPFVDLGINSIVRQSQLRINSGQLQDINSTFFGCPALDTGFNCVGGRRVTFPADLSPISGTNYTPRMSTGLELQVFLPVINAPFRVYWAYNPLRLDTTSGPGPTKITRDMFPPGGSGDFTFQQALSLFGPNYLLREPRKTFRFTVATTF